MYYVLNKIDKQKVIRNLAEYVDEINLAKIIVDYIGTEKICEKCYEPLGKEWKRLPCEHYIHKKCYPKDNQKCPNCNYLIVLPLGTNMDKSNF